MHFLLNIEIFFFFQNERMYSFGKVNFSPAKSPVLIWLHSDERKLPPFAATLPLGALGSYNPSRRSLKR